MSSDAQTRLMALPILQDNAVMQGILQQADEGGLWESLLPQIKRMSETQLQQVGAIASDMSEQAQQRILAAAHRAGLWDQLFDIVSSLPIPKRGALQSAVASFAQLDPSLIDEFATQAKQHGLGDLLNVAKAAVGRG